MITAPKRIDLIEPEIPHPDGVEGETIYDIAQRLEARYAVFRKFVELRKSDIERILVSEMVLGIKHNYTNEYMDKQILGRVKQLWSVFIVNEEHGIRTKAAETRGGSSFVKTGAYKDNFRIGVIH